MERNGCCTTYTTLAHIVLSLRLPVLHAATSSDFASVPDSDGAEPMNKTFT